MAYEGVGYSGAPPAGKLTFLGVPTATVVANSVALTKVQVGVVNPVRLRKVVADRTQAGSAKLTIGSILIGQTEVSAGKDPAPLDMCSPDSVANPDFGDDLPPIDPANGFSVGIGNAGGVATTYLLLGFVAEQLAGR